MAVIEGIDDQVLLSIGTIAVFCGAVILWTVKSSTNNRFTVQISPNIDQPHDTNDTSPIIQRPTADRHQADVYHHRHDDQTQDNNLPTNSYQTLPTFTQGSACTASSSHHHDKTTVDDDPPAAATSNLRNRSHQQTDNDDSHQNWTIKIILLDRNTRTVCVSPTSTIQQLKQ